jgi:hypothetical protein
VVTGHDALGRSIFVADGVPPVTVSPGDAGVAVTELWKTREMPVSNAGNDETTGTPVQLHPPANGTVFRIVEYQPDNIRASGGRSAHFAEMGAEHAVDRSGARHFGFHKTDTIDYAIVLDGEIYAMMDEGESLLKAGDVLIQRGTNHAWSNRTDKPVRVAFVLIDAQPVATR